jgi:hypothetical protein
MDDAGRSLKRSISRPELHLLALFSMFVVVLFSTGVVSADAATRFAFPGATGQPPCQKADPCSLFVAASSEVASGERAQAGDDVIVLPGAYSGPAGDLGPDEAISVPVEVNIRGASGSPPPLISSSASGVVVGLNGHSTAAQLEITSSTSRMPLRLSQSTAERLIVRTSAAEGIACSLGFRAILRDSVCISTGDNGAGAGQRVSTNSFVDQTRTLRNVTAIGAGPESSGLLFDISDGEIFVNAKSTIAQGTAVDVEAIGAGIGGGSTITLEDSDFATAKAVQTGRGIASVTDPGTNGNLTAPPLLAEDQIHQMPASPTVDQGILDSSSGPFDIDGGPRLVCSRPDIGADELPGSAAIASYFAPVGSMSAARTSGVSAPLPDGKVLVAGGFYGFWHTSAEIFDPTLNTFSANGVGSMSIAREGAVAAPLPDGRILVAGGNEKDDIYSSAEIFDPVTRTFSSEGIGAMVSPRSRAVAAPLPDGRVLIAGGANGPALGSAEIFDPDTGAFSAAGVGPMRAARANAAAAPLGDGRVLIAGGSNFSVNFNSASAEVFDPGTGSFTSAGIGSMSVERIFPVAAPLPDGRVLVAGGAGPSGEGDGGWYSSAEIFDPTTDTFGTQAIGKMQAPRSLAAASPLPDGRVLLAGGYRGPEGSGPGMHFQSAEVFVPEPSPSGTGLDFGSHEVGQSSADRVLEITNLGAQELGVASIDLLGPDANDFVIDDDGCLGLALAFEASCAIDVRFTPTGSGPRSASVRLTDNASTSPHLFQLAGAGVAVSGPTAPSGCSAPSGCVQTPLDKDPGPSAEPPDTILLHHPARRTTRRRLTFTFNSNQPEVRYTCRLSGGLYRSCISPFRSRVGLGSHVFKVRAVGTGGPDPSPATFHWTVHQPKRASR